MSMICQILYGVASKGTALEQLLQEAGLTERELKNSTLKLPWERGVKVWEAALLASGDNAFGLHTGQSVTTAMAGLVGHMMERSKNLYEASLALQKYLPFANEMIDFRSRLDQHYLMISIQPVEL